MELSKLTGSLAAYGNNGVQGNQSGPSQQAGAAAAQLDPRQTQTTAKSATGSTSVPESTRVTLSEDGLRRAAEEAQANQQVSEMAAQAVAARVPGNSSIDRNTADNPRSAVVSRTDTPEANARRTREDSAVNSENRSTVNAETQMQERSRTQRVEAESQAEQQRVVERQQQERQQEERRMQARQDSPSAAQSGIAAYRGVFAY